MNMTKRMIGLFLSVGMIVSVLTAFPTLAVEAADTHTHSFVKQITYAATCLRDGYTVYKCESCGKTENRDVISAKGHAFQDGVCLRCDAADPNNENGGQSNGRYDVDLSIDKASCTDVMGQILAVVMITNRGQKQATGFQYEIREGAHDGTVVFTGNVEALNPGESFAGHEILFSSMQAWESYYFVLKSNAANPDQNPSNNYAVTIMSPMGGGCLHVFDQIAPVDSKYHKISCNNCGKSFQNEHLFLESVGQSCLICGEYGGEAHTHDYTSWEMLDEHGHIGYCSVCGKEEYQSHAWDIEEIVDNIEMIECFYCGATRTEIHEHTFYEDEVYDPTCLSEGYSLHKCVWCDVEEKRDLIPALGHLYSEEGITVSQSCTSDGYTQYECVRCGDIKKDAFIPAHGHRFEMGETVEPTCQTEGYTLFTCKFCQETQKRYMISFGKHEYVDGTCLCCGKTKTDYEMTDLALSVRQFWFSTGELLLAITVENRGRAASNESVVMFSDNSSDKREFVEFLAIPALQPGEKYERNTVFSVELTDVYFTVASCRIKLVYDHDSDKSNNYNEFLLSKSGECQASSRDIFIEWEAADAFQHKSHCAVYGGNTCDKTHYTGHWFDGVFGEACVTCGQEYHVHTAYNTVMHSEDLHSRVYDCGDVEYFPHYWEPVTVTKPATLAKKGTRTYTCMECGATRTEVYLHVNHVHHYDIFAVCPPTCETEGYTVYKCSDCGKSLTSEGIPARGHQYEISVVQPTCQSQGYKKYACRNCEYTYQHAIIAGKHSYEEGVCVSCGKTYTQDAFTDLELIGRLMWFDDGVFLLAVTVTNLGSVTSKEATVNISENSGEGTDLLPFFDIPPIAPGECCYRQYSFSIEETDRIFTYFSTRLKLVYDQDSNFANNFFEFYISKQIPHNDSVMIRHQYKVWEYADEIQHKSACLNEKCEVAYYADHWYDENVGDACVICGYQASEHIHSFSQWHLHLDTQHIRSCDCGETEYASHLWTPGVVTTPATHTKEGILTYACAECEATMTESLPKLTETSNYAEVSVSTYEARPGETIQVWVRAQNNPGLAAMAFKIHYDSTVLSLTDVTYSTALEGQTFSPTVIPGAVELSWASDEGNDVVDGLFAVLTFKVSVNVPVGAYTDLSVTYVPWNVCTADGEKVPLKMVPGKVVVKDQIVGDINNDGACNNKDVTRFMQYQAGWDVTVNPNVLDVNGDGQINNKDVTRLMQYVAGWDVDIYA